MNYGWVIFIFLACMGALAYFGVLDSTRFLPRSCTIAPGIGCDDFRVQQDSVTMVLRNGMGESITISDLSVEDCTESVNGSLQYGDTEIFIVGGCVNLVNTRFDKQVYLTYIPNNGIINHTLQGQVIGKVEVGTAFLHFSDDFGESAPSRHFGFNSGALPPDYYPGWTVLTGSWIIENGILKNWYGGDLIRINSPAGEPPGRTLRAKSLETQYWRYSSLLIGWQDENNYYSLIGNVGNFRLQKRVGGESTTLDEIDVDIGLSTWYNMEVRWVSSTQLEAEVWDENMNSLGTLQAPISEGWTVGDYALKTARGAKAVWFDNIQIRSVVS